MDDFIAILKYRTTEDGGRKTPAKSGYRPQVQFPFEIMSTSGTQTFINTEIVSPGDTVEAAIKMLSPEFFEGRLIEGMEFKCIEGDIIVATGVVKTIINKKLKISS